MEAEVRAVAAFVCGWGGKANGNGDRKRSGVVETPCIPVRG